MARCAWRKQEMRTTRNRGTAAYRGNVDAFDAIALSKTERSLTLTEVNRRSMPGGRSRLAVLEIARLRMR